MLYESDAAIVAVENVTPEPKAAFSLSVKIRPIDSRCRYWAKIIRNGESIPHPDLVVTANDVPGKYLRRGDEELLPGDALLEGEANHHRNSRGWSYCITYCGEGESMRIKSNEFGELKKQIKANGIDPELLKGSGDVAAMIRILHAIRAGMKFAL